jgi:hypothetical protein
LQRCSHGLSNIHVARHHRAINRRVDGGVVKISLCHSDRGLFLLHLRARLLLLGQRSGYLCLCGVRICLCQVKRLLTDDALLPQANIAVIIGFRLQSSRLRLGRVCDGYSQVRLGILIIGLGLRQCAFEQRGINLRDQLPFSHLGIEIDVQLGDSTGNL